MDKTKTARSISSNGGCVHVNYFNDCMVMLPTDLDTETINQWLERGDRQMIAAELGVHPATVRNALKKRTKNFRVIERCYELAMEKMNKFIRMQEQTNLLRQKIQEQ